jgi:hypothetical protein
MPSKKPQGMTYTAQQDVSLLPLDARFDIAWTQKLLLSTSIGYTIPRSDCNSTVSLLLPDAPEK